MSTDINVNTAGWLERARELLRAASTPSGIRASLVDLDNYEAVFARDAVMAGIAGILLGDETIIAGLRRSVTNFRDLQGKQGQIASNYVIKSDESKRVSFGTLSPKIDSCTWYLVGVGLLIKEGHLQLEDFRTSITKTVELLDAIEYNGKHLMYIPSGGNWADEYAYEGYILYDQVLRAWGLSLVGHVCGVPEWAGKAEAIFARIEERYQHPGEAYLYASIYPGGACEKFDLAAHTLLAIAGGRERAFAGRPLGWIVEKFVTQGKLPPVFHPIITEGDPEWEALSQYHLFGFKNKPHHYHNGGIWWIWLGWLAVALSTQGKYAALEKLRKLAFSQLNDLDDFNFDEYLAADDLLPYGTSQLCYTATGIILLALADGSSDFSRLVVRNAALIKEPLQVDESYLELSNQLVEQLQQRALLNGDKCVIGICGESGSGKSITAKCLQMSLRERGISSVILHQDSYYKLPPRQNHEKRKADIGWVGPNELRMPLLQEHVNLFRKHAADVVAPVVDYEDNSFSESTVHLADKSILIVEGVYALLLDRLDFGVFLDRSYVDTLADRRQRTREVYDPFVEEVLAIEHGIVRPLRRRADLVISRDYTIVTAG